MNIQSIPTIAQCVEVGTIARPHGKEGEVLVNSKNVAQEDFNDLPYVFSACKSDWCRFSYKKSPSKIIPYSFSLKTLRLWKKLNCT